MVGGSGQQMKSLPVKVEMEGKRVLIGELIIAHIKTLNEALNDTKQFLEFSTPEGTLQFISKKTIVHIESLDHLKSEAEEKQKAAKQNAQKAKVKAKAKAAEAEAEAEEKADHLHVKKTNNPFELLGISEDAYDIEVQHAYHEKAKMYHPDRFANTELPSEVMEYMMTQAQLVNAAYTEVCRIKEDKSLSAADAKGFSI